MTPNENLESADPGSDEPPIHAKETKMQRRLTITLRVGLSILTIVLLMFWILGMFRTGRIQPGKAAVPERPAAGLATQTVEFKTIPAVDEAVGTVRAEHIATVASRVVAGILKMSAAAGQRVTEGELLAELDDRDLRARLEQAREAVRAAEAAVAQAQSNYKRDRPLFDQQVISAYDFEHTQTNLKAAEANLNRLRGAEQEAEVNLSYAVIRSPFDGVVVDKLADAGDLAAPGKPLLTMYQEGRLWLEASVPEGQLARVLPGQSYTVRIDARERAMRGQAVEIVPSSDPATRTVLARIRLGDTRDLLPGMFGRLLIPAPPQQVLVVPAESVIRVGQLTMVDVVRQGRVERRSVQLGGAAGGQYEVLSGLAAGDNVVVPGGEGAAGRKSR